MTRILVCVHGACIFHAGFSNPWWESLRPYTNIFGDGVLGETRIEVVWSDIVNRKYVTGAQLLLGDQIRRSINKTSLPLVACTHDFMSYMLNEQIRESVIATFANIVGRCIDNGYSLDIISHSWGTVVAYEGLLLLDNYYSKSTIPVHTLFTAGCPLGIVPVANHLKPENRGGRKPNLVNRWVNIDCAGDVIGGPLTGAYKIDVDAVGIPAYDCPDHDALCAHESYFAVGNVDVNRDIFAKYIND